MTTTANAEKCQMQVTSDGWHFHTCGRNVKRDGVCGIHAAARDREAARAAEQAAAQAARTESRRFAALLGAYGVEATASDGRVFLTDPAALVALLEAASGGVSPAAQTILTELAAQAGQP